MTITYHGHSCFRLKGKKGTLVTDPFDDYIGFRLANLSADVVTVSHDHKDHNQAARVKGTSRRAQPFVIDHPGEYEVGGISVFGVQTFHDKLQGAERGINVVFTTLIDQVRVCHLGDLGHLLDEDTQTQIGMVDVLLVPVGGVASLNAEEATKVIHMLEPSIVIPMHYKTASHDPKVFADFAPVKSLKF
jgi:L-ascorbate metabolism protein UlaG (beta-lactamase superfamily)